MRRYWIESQLSANGEFTIEGESFHHIFDVCRQEVGHQFEVLIGDGKARLVEVLEVGKKTARVQEKSVRNLEPIPRPLLKLCLSISRFPVMDAVIEKAVELGVVEIRPFVSEFSFIRSVDEISENRKGRWEKIIKSATQQCGRGELMTMAPVASLRGLLEDFNRTKGELGLFLYEGKSTFDIRDWSQRQTHSNPDSIWLFVGSEGGFSERESKLFQEFSLDPVTLGSQVLRVETACVAVLSILKYQWRLMK